MVRRKNTDITSSNKITVYLRTGKNSGVTKQLHTEFANVQDDDAAIHQFTKRWGSLSSKPLVAAGWQHWRDLLRSAWANEAVALEELRGWATRNMIASLNFSEGRIEMESDPLLGAIYLLFIRDHLAGNTAVCEHEHCKGDKYFIKAKGTQKFCGHPECSAYAQRAYALKNWNERGKLLREQRRKKAQQRKAGK